MNLQIYINLYQLLQTQETTHEANRAFGLAHPKADAVTQLSLWTKQESKALRKPLLSEQFSAYLYGTTLALGVLALLLGIFSGIGLLSYSGKEPVNIVYFLAMVLFVPLFTMLLSLFSMLRANRTQSLLIHLSPAFWMERMMRFLPNQIRESLSSLRINPLLLNWLVIQRAQLLALLFSLGLLLSLLGVVSTKDIAFAWSTTLQVTPETFHQLLSMIASPWRGWLPSAVPSVELIEQSQYFRLGQRLDSQMLAHAAKLGEWWKFLAMTTLCYAIMLRLGMWLLARFGLQRAWRRALLSLEGVARLRYEMNTPLVTTTATTDERTFVQGSDGYGRMVTALASEYDTVLGWATTLERIEVFNDSFGVEARQMFDVGGTKSLAEDSQTVVHSVAEVLLYTKAWEPPTMDLVDFLSELTVVAQRVTLLPVGMDKDAYRATPRELEIWKRKLHEIDNPKVWLCQNS
jgi:hypothetical protein